MKTKGQEPITFSLSTADTLIQAKKVNIFNLNEEEIIEFIADLLEHKHTANNRAGKKYLFISGEVLPEKFKQELVKNNIDFKEMIF